MPPIASPVRYSATAEEIREQRERVVLDEVDISVLGAMAEEITPFLRQRRKTIKRIDINAEIFDELTIIAKEREVHISSVIMDLLARGLAAYRVNSVLIRPTFSTTKKSPRLPTAHTPTPVSERPTLGDE